MSQAAHPSMRAHWSLFCTVDIHVFELPEHVLQRDIESCGVWWINAVLQFVPQYFSSTPIWEFQYMPFDVETQRKEIVARLATRNSQAFGQVNVGPRGHDSSELPKLHSKKTDESDNKAPTTLPSKRRKESSSHRDNKLPKMLSTEDEPATLAAKKRKVTSSHRDSKPPKMLFNRKTTRGERADSDSGRSKKALESPSNPFDLSSDPIGNYLSNPFDERVDPDDNDDNFDPGDQGSSKLKGKQEESDFDDDKEDHDNEALVFRATCECSKANCLWENATPSEQGLKVSVSCHKKTAHDQQLFRDPDIPSTRKCPKRKCGFTE